MIEVKDTKDKRNNKINNSSNDRSKGKGINNSLKDKDKKSL